MRTFSFFSSLYSSLLSVLISLHFILSLSLSPKSHLQPASSSLFIQLFHYFFVQNITVYFICPCMRHFLIYCLSVFSLPNRNHYFLSFLWITSSPYLFNNFFQLFNLLSNSSPYFYALFLIPSLPAAFSLFSFCISSLISLSIISSKYLISLFSFFSYNLFVLPFLSYFVKYLHKMLISHLYIQLFSHSLSRSSSFVYKLLHL